MENFKKAVLSRIDSDLSAVSAISSRHPRFARRKVLDLEFERALIEESDSSLCVLHCIDHDEHCNSVPVVRYCPLSSLPHVASVFNVGLVDLVGSNSVSSHYNLYYIKCNM